MTNQKQSLARARDDKPLYRAPHLARRLDDEPQLRCLRFDGDLVAVDGAREPALRRHAHLLDGRELCRLVDTAFQRVLRLELYTFRADESEHDRLAFGYV